MIVLKVPYIRTHRSIAREMVRLAELKEGEVVYDLGAGDGQVLVAAKENQPNIRAIGCEVVPTVWLLGRLHLWIRCIKIEWKLQNAMTQDVTDADVIFLYVTPHLMKQLESKFDSELKHGTRIISNTFRFPSRKPTKEVKVAFRNGWKKIYVYEW